MHSFGRKITAEEAALMISEADDDGDGTIDMKEFHVIMAAKNKNLLWGDAATSANKLHKQGKNSKKGYKAVQSLADDAGGRDDPDFDADIDFVVNMSTRKMMCRASSNAEKVAWTKALQSATRVRSYSSKNLDDGMDPEDVLDKLHNKMKHLTLAELDIGDIIGSGTMGTVRLTVHIPTGERVAVKIIPKRKFFMNQKLQKSTERELDMLDKISAFKHPSIVQMFGYINADDNVYIALELCEGGELLEQLESLGSYSEGDAAGIVEVTVSTLGYLHGEGIVHRDVKPENLLLKIPGDSKSIKIADFGLSNIIEGKSLQTVCGSPAYMAPEVHNMTDYDEKVDLWSVGVMLYLLLCGSLPFTPPRMLDKAESEDYNFSGKLWKQVSDGAKDLVSHLLVADPTKRYSVEEALNHPWITGENRDHVDLEGTRKALALFSAKRKFKGIAHAVVASKRMTKAMASFGVQRIAPALDKGREALTDLRYTATNSSISVGGAAVAAVGGAMPDAVRGAVIEKTSALKEGLTSQLNNLAASPRVDIREAKMGHVRVWLENCHLGQYADKFEEEGYDDVDAIKDLDEEELNELCDEVGMKTGHRRNFKKRFAALTAEVPQYDAAGHVLLDQTIFLSLPMPSGTPDQDSFVLGESIGRVRGVVAMSPVIDEDSTHQELLHVAHPRIKSPPREKPPGEKRPGKPGARDSGPKKRSTTPRAGAGAAGTGVLGMGLETE